MRAYFKLLLLFILPFIVAGTEPSDKNCKGCKENNLSLKSLDNEISSELQRAALEGHKYVENMIDLESRLLSNGLTAKKRGRRQSLHYKRVSNQSRDKSINALKVIAATKQLQQSSNTIPRGALSSVSLKGTVLENTCLEPISCNVSKYRSIDGSCNNLVNPHWGQRNTVFQRLLPAHYGNGIDSPRPDSNGGELENPRIISLYTVKTYGLDEISNVTLSVMSFGQFITHDVTFAEDFTYENGSSPACCDSQGQMLPPESLHPQCLPIETSVNDPSYPISGSTCMSFTRSKVGTDYSCTLGQAKQLNSNTHFLDGSQIYGSDVTTSDELRSGVDGLLKTTNVNGRELFPIVPGCEGLANHELAVCFQAGDVRVEENPQLTAIHLIFLREHNRIAKQLKTLNPQWDDETLFQETRRIVIALLQHITYNEYLPSLLGPEIMGSSGLTLPSEGYGTGYDETIDPSITNDFTAGAFRVTHSSIQGFLRLLNAADQDDTERSFSLSDYFFDASRLMDDQEFFDSILRGFTKQPPQIIDNLYTSEVTGRLYRGKNPIGGDLVAITIQRGREHGIPGYNQFREWCGLPKASDFSELNNEMYAEEINLLKDVYKTVDDIDLYIGCLNEIHVPGTLMGPTALCIVKDQFAKLKNGDRFFYDIGEQPHSFTIDQLNQIRQSSLARLICDNNDGTVVNMQPRAMTSPIGTNQRVPCTSIPSMDLSFWKEN